MNTSLFLAKVLGLYLFIGCLAVLYKTKNVQAAIAWVTKNDSVMFASGFIALLFGLVIVVAHPVWEISWRGLITLIGWIGVFKGLARLFWPERVVQWMVHWSKTDKFKVIVGVFAVMGGYLTYIGFWL